MFNMPGGFEWLVILIVALLIFGSRLPSVMRSLGRGVAEFKKGLRESEEELNRAAEKPPGADKPKSSSGPPAGNSPAG